MLVQNGLSDALEEVSRQSTARPQMYAYHVSFDSIHRGNACIRCRMRKMKCDANKDGCYKPLTPQTLRYSDPAVSLMTEGIDRLRTTVSPIEPSYAAQETASAPSIPQLFSNRSQPTTSSNSPLGVGVLPGPTETRIVGGWHDSTDLPTAMRDRLLGWFFKEAKRFFLGVDRPRLQIRLTLEPRKRPHPCWMYAMVSSGSQAAKERFLTGITIVPARRNVFSGAEFA